MTCDYLLPTSDPALVSWGKPLPSCILQEGHKGDHLIYTDSGRYAVFMPYTEPCDEECECAEDTSTTNFECYTWGWVTKEEAEQMLGVKN